MRTFSGVRYIMLKKGFTLIELLIVITIIAILVGAALPYVQDYVFEARLSRARTDLNEIRNALIRYETETEKSYNATGTMPLVGTYLEKHLIDPWGNPYYVATESSIVFSFGPNNTEGTLPADLEADGYPGDLISTEFRPPLALVRAYWLDQNNNGIVDDADQILLRFTRSPTNDDNVEGFAGMRPQTLEIGIDGVYTTLTQTDIAPSYFEYGLSEKDLVLNLQNVNFPDFVPGRDTIRPTPENAEPQWNIVDRAYEPFGPSHALLSDVVIRSF